eukprot:CAMPEP_0196575876 /NCGR_PEP_ID=MMETSP1081-20130531/5268_1 /TAXON_ID=36882 /ORGANISM="Pyramimonas amylifera, Strain CCMP720" /LENGTH=155 /DNA_ID=CAMNT_0041894309 /DNA_START=622 /DNA_END=1085 /DNA_ORIENTATION=+
MKGLYRGLSAPLIGGSFECGVNYGVFYGVNKYMQGGKEGLDMDLKGLVVSGMAAGTVLSFILSPTELIKCRLQSGAPPGYPPYKGPINVIQRLVQTEGLRAGLGRGLAATLAREIPGNTIFFVVYEYMRMALPRQKINTERGEDVQSLQAALQQV